MKHYKVVTQDMKSLGLRKNPNIMTFEVGVPAYEKYKIFKDKRDNGGIWVANGIGGANTLKKYMKEKYDKDCRVFEVEIGEVLYQNSYRIKTDCVTLGKEITYG